MHNDTKNKQLTSKILKKHNMNTEDKSYKCGMYGKTFKYKPYSIRYQTIHVKPYECELCDKSFNEKKNLEKHKVSVHDYAGNYKCIVSYQCGLCDVSFSKKENVYEHKGLVHDDDKNYKCIVNVYKAHLNRKIGLNHSLEKLYKCHQCLLFVHPKKTHTCSKYLCEVCSKLFNDKENRDDHHFEHSDVKQYECSVCDKGYTTKECLVAHIRNEGHISDLGIVRNKLQPITEWIKYVYDFAKF